MRTLNITGLFLQCDGDQTTHGDAMTQAKQVIDQINGVLQREPYGIGAQIIVDERMFAEFEESMLMEEAMDRPGGDDPDPNEGA